MRTLQKFLILWLIFGLFISCSETNSEKEPTEIVGALVSNSECKSNAGIRSSTTIGTPDTLSCINFTYKATEKLLNIEHINAGFNCCPGTLSCNISISNDTIIIVEEEEAPMCNCNCLFDLEIEITGVLADSYIVKIVEPYLQDMKALMLNIDLANENEGSYCVTRKQYPWGLNY